MGIVDIRKWLGKNLKSIIVTMMFQVGIIAKYFACTSMPAVRRLDYILLNIVIFQFVLIIVCSPFETISIVEMVDVKILCLRSRSAH